VAEDVGAFEPIADTALGWKSIMGQVRCDVRSIKSSKPQLTTTSNVASYSIFRESTTCTQRGSHETATSLIAFGKSTISLVTTIA
jgi:hypothetical protein